MIIDFLKKKRKKEQEYRKDIGRLINEDLDEFASMLGDTVKNVCLFADEYNYDRDNILAHLASRLTIVSELGSIKNFDVEVWENDRD